MQPPPPTELHYRTAPAVLVARLNEVHDTKWVAQEALGQLREDLYRLRRRCETFKALTVALAEDDWPLAGRCAARLLHAGWRPLKVLVRTPGWCSPGTLGQGCRRPCNIGRGRPLVVVSSERGWVPT